MFLFKKDKKEQDGQLNSVPEELGKHILLESIPND